MQATTDSRREAAGAVQEAARAAADTSRRTIEQLQAATRISRGWLEESRRLGRQMFSIWIMGMEVPLKASLEMQDAALSASIPIYSAAIQQWATVARLANETTLEAIRMTARRLERVTVGTAEETASS